MADILISDAETAINQFDIDYLNEDSTNQSRFGSITFLLTSLIELDVKQLKSICEDEKKKNIIEKLLEFNIGDTTNRDSLNDLLEQFKEKFKDIFTDDEEEFGFSEKNLMEFEREQTEKQKIIECIKKFFENDDDDFFSNTFGVEKCVVSKIFSKKFQKIFENDDYKELKKLIMYYMVQGEIDILIFLSYFEGFVEDDIDGSSCKDDFQRQIDYTEEKMESLLTELNKTFNSGEVNEDINIKLQAKIVRLQKKNYRFICNSKKIINLNSEEQIGEYTEFKIEGKGEGVDEVKIIHKDNSTSEISVDELKKIILASSLVIEEEEVTGSKGGSRRKTIKRKFNKKKSKRNRKTKTKNRNKKTRNRKNKNRKYSKKRN